ncbi:MAG: hypothetical protein D3905_05825 [Candidatus Electrothrix sp. AS4_5]|nr:hypothetical protein [Candidatus Electrothrix gigas]
MHPILFHLNGITIYTYGTAMVLIFILTLILLTCNFPHHLFSLVDLYNFCLIILVVILFKHHLLSYIFYDILKIQHGTRPHIDALIGGHSSHIVLIATVIMFYIYCKLRKISLLPTLDFLLPYAILALALQRIFGCFMAGCCYGKPTTLFCGVTFPANSNAGTSFPHIRIHPTQLYYGVSALAIWYFLYWYRKRNNDTGKITALGIGLFAISYFCITFLRGDTMTSNMLSTSQYSSLVLLIFSAILYRYSHIQMRNQRTIDHE